MVPTNQKSESLFHFIQIVIPLHHCMSIQCYCIVAHTAVCMVLLDIVYTDTGRRHHHKLEAISYHCIYKYNHVAFLEEAHIIARISYL